MSNYSPDINKWLLPLSWLYGLVVFIREKLFDWKILSQAQFDIPVICVGNITVGGTGKTPHIEYIIRLLEKDHNIAVLSRGYKRATKGFILADEKSSFEEIGDEPYQIKNKFPDVIVAVDEDRKRGIGKLLSLKKKPDIILLDDGFQHRYVKPSYSIVLTDYNRPVFNDALLPAGRLREPVAALERANMIIVTKCPPVLKPIDTRIMLHDLNVFPYQTLLFSRIKYDNLVSLFNQKDLFSKNEIPLDSISNKKVLLVAGIASPEILLRKIRKYTDSVKLITYPDHHNFTQQDIKAIEQTFYDLGDKDTITVLTEKDAVRMAKYNKLSEKLKNSMYYLPISIDFLTPEDKMIFNNKIRNHATKNTGDSELHKE